MKPIQQRRQFFQAVTNENSLQRILKCVVSRFRYCRRIAATFTVLLFVFTAMAANLVSITRTCLRDNEVYVVMYEYDPLGPYSVPATIPPGQPHYPCNVTVFRKESTNAMVQIGKPFRGEVTPNGCFEDKPEDMVGKALSQK